MLYRRQFFNYDLENECHWIQAMNLADFTVPYGVIRADKLRLFSCPIRLTLGSYGFPDNGTQIIEKTADGAKAIILKGHDHTGREKQMAMTIYDGWDELEIVKSTGTNPDSELYRDLCKNCKRKEIWLSAVCTYFTGYHKGKS